MPSHGDSSSLLSVIRALDGVGARRFGAVNTDTINCGSAARLDDIGGTNATQTYLGWFRASSLGSNRGLISKGFGFGNGGLGVLASDGAGNLQLCLDRAGTDLNRFTSGGNLMRVGQWRMIAVTVDLGAASAVRLYSGGVNRAADEHLTFTGSDGSGARVTDAGNDFLLGNLSIGSRNFAFVGDVGPCALFDRVLSLAEVRAWQAEPWKEIPNRIGLWLPGHKHGRVIDWSGNGNHGTPNGTQLVEGPTIYVRRSRFPVRGFVASSALYTQNLIGSMVTSATLGRRTDKPLTGAGAPTGALTRATTKSLVGATMPSGAVATLKLFVRAFAGAVTWAGTLGRSTARTLAAAITSAGVLVRRANRSLTGSTAPNGVLEKRSLKAVTGAVTSAGTLATLKVALRSVTGAIAWAATVTRATVKGLGGTSTPSGDTAKRTARSLGGSAAPSAVRWKRTARGLVATVGPAGAVQAQRIVSIELLEVSFRPSLVPTITYHRALFARLAFSVVNLSPTHTIMTAAPDRLPLGVDVVFHLKGVKVFDPNTGTRVLATGLTIVARVAATPTGAALDASLSLTLTERAAGEYYGVLQGSASETYARAYLGALVYGVLQSGSDYIGHFPMRVIDGVALGA